MLEEVGGENGGGSSTRSKRARAELLKAELIPWNGEEYARTRDTCLEIGEKTAGQGFSPCSENTTCSLCKASRRSQQKRRR